ncbi:hypothetical protein JOC85_003147 [Bacillus mesophilus]|uniref:DUF3307 domain-containing protein n=1 Tax=Bacillus mesophilus TaxID=1808955 RepID=A0A6M0QBY2_9BACI|nr:DUF3307 domain-containing protein [Bacillus mesophilus]MBM7662340.1 hypothetical protein [Bacillus mesophilus]NEY73030.1 DUF3307 domain-containing protein [Bacillus mesophilus]
MSQFDFLLIGHFIGDFLLQTSWMAQYKATKWIPLLTHVTIYTIVVAIFGFLSGGLSLWGIAIIFIGHVILDRKKFVSFWVKKIQRADGPSLGWLSIVTDQVFHLILLAIAIYV